MSRQNKVNPGMYTQRGRLTQDDAAREIAKQRSVGSEHTWQPVQRDQEPRLTSESEGDDEDAGIAALFDQAKGLAKDLGFDLQDVKQTGGGSDGNFTAALGIPTLDGLGPDGKGAHTDYEQIYFSSLQERTRLMLRLFETLE